MDGWGGGLLSEVEIRVRLCMGMLSTLRKGRGWEPGCQHHPNKGRIYRLSLFPYPKEAARPLLVQSRAGNHHPD